MDNSLSAQERAIAHVAARSEGGPIDPALRVTLNFHPDRRVGEVLMLEAMARDGLYLSQFETGTSNGGLTAHPGGDRWSWESRLFGTAYDEVPASERPKYGSLNSGAEPQVARLGSDPPTCASNKRPWPAQRSATQTASSSQPISASP